MLIAVAFASCEKPSVESSTDIELIPAAGYIRFSTGVATKAPIIENLRGKSFGVLGYSYGFNSNWDIARPLATPELFYDLTVVCAAENGVCTYDMNNLPEDGNQLQPWNLAKKYSFFSYYPMSSSDNGISISGQNAVNMPTVTYSLPLKSQTSGEVDPDDLQDLMTASAIDMTAGVGLVGFTFQHRLFCIEVLAQNFNTENIIENEDGTTTSIDADEYISNLKLTIDNLAYQEITVPMMKGDELTQSTVVANSYGAVDFRLLESSEEVKVPSHDEGAGVVSLSGTDGSKIVMLVPQDASDTKMTGSLSFNLKNSVGTEVTVTRNFESDINFQEGKKYTIVISFTGETIVIALAESGAWEPYPVNYEFE